MFQLKASTTWPPGTVESSFVTEPMRQLRQWQRYLSMSTMKEYHMENTSGLLESLDLLDFEK